ncbi:MAG: ATP-binding protein [Pseudomonadota bacterium]
MTIDDLTALVSAQREAAWGDVARRIAHEIKNPLTPIQLSAERLKRKFGKLAGDERENFDQYADVIVRQAADIRRMVDEFSRFARMPEPETAPTDLAKLTREAVLLQSAAREDIAYDLTGAEDVLMVDCDAGLISQALTNLLKNAAEAIDGRLETTPEPGGEIRVRLADVEGAIRLTIEDNGVGLPGAERSRLTEPYVTTRKKGTGLGLAIVKKIAEQHRGALTLEDAAPFAEGQSEGARAVITLPTTSSSQTNEKKDSEA